MSQNPIQEQEIIKLLKIYYGIYIQAAHLIPGGADINALVYKADAKSNSHSYFVKFKYGTHDEINLSVIRLLHDSGIKEIIFPIHTLEGKITSAIRSLYNDCLSFYPCAKWFYSKFDRNTVETARKCIKKNS